MLWSKKMTINITHCYKISELLKGLKVKHSYWTILLSVIQKIAVIEDCNMFLASYFFSLIVSLNAAFNWSFDDSANTIFNAIFNCGYCIPMEVNCYIIFWRGRYCTFICNSPSLNESDSNAIILWQICLCTLSPKGFLYQFVFPDLEW